MRKQLPQAIVSGMCIGCSGFESLDNPGSPTFARTSNVAKTRATGRLLKNYCATLIRTCAVLAILMYFLCTLRFLRSGRTRLKAARGVLQQPANRVEQCDQQVALVNSGSTDFMHLTFFARMRMHLHHRREDDAKIDG
jgi:hypothetical protein